MIRIIVFLLLGKQVPFGNPSVRLWHTKLVLLLNKFLFSFIMSLTRNPFIYLYILFNKCVCLWHLYQQLIYYTYITDFWLIIYVYNNIYIYSINFGSSESKLAEFENQLIIYMSVYWLYNNINVNRSPLIVCISWILINYQHSLILFFFKELFGWVRRLRLK